MSKLILKRNRKQKTENRKHFTFTEGPHTVQVSKKESHVSHTRIQGPFPPIYNIGKDHFIVRKIVVRKINRLGLGIGLGLNLEKKEKGQKLVKNVLRF